MKRSRASRRGTDRFPNTVFMWRSWLTTCSVEEPTNSSSQSAASRTAVAASADAPGASSMAAATSMLVRYPELVRLAEATTRRTIWCTNSEAAGLMNRKSATFACNFG